jgi:hypothetical protein
VKEGSLFRSTARALILGAVAVALFAGDADALRYHPRPAWMAGVGLGIGRGTFIDPAGAESGYRSGVSPQIRIGRMLGQRAMIGFNYDGWLIEYGEVPTKHRRSLQNAALALTLFPGNPEGPWGGLYLRAGAGVGLTGTAEVEIVEGGKQERGERVDEWGVGAVAELGYEFWITDNFAAGLVSAFNYFDIGETIVDTAWFGSAGLTLNLYF